MNWSAQKTRIQKFLRDPTAKIWDNNFLLRLYNDEQNDLQNQIGQIEDVRVVMMPSKVMSSYMWDWEWPYNDSDDGEVYQVGRYDDTNQYVCLHIWELEHLESLTPTTSSLGDVWTQPWEVWEISTPAEPPPVPFPVGFHRAKFVAWDKKPIEPSTLREIQNRDSTYKTRQGDPMYYYRDEKISNRHYLYPLPSSITWTDQDNEDADPDEAEYGSTTLDVDDNLLVIFEKNATDLSDDDGVSAFAPFLHKYIEYGVISRAYGANTDGRIRSLAEYWNLRKQTGIKAIRMYLSNRRVDRDYCFTGRGATPVRSTRHPRLPDAFPSLSSFNSQ